MFDILRDKTLYNKMILAALPLTAVCSTALSSFISALAIVLTVVLSAVCINLLKGLLTPETAKFAHIIIAVGIAGVFAASASLFAKETVADIGFYLPLLAVTATVLADSDFALENGIITTFAGGALTGSVSGIFLLSSGIIRELAGLGSLFGIDIYTKWFTPMDFFTTPAGGLLTAALLTVIYNLLVIKTGKKEAAK